MHWFASSANEKSGKSFRLVYSHATIHFCLVFGSLASHSKDGAIQIFSPVTACSRWELVWQHSKFSIGEVITLPYAQANRGYQMILLWVLSAIPMKNFSNNSIWNQEHVIEIVLFANYRIMYNAFPLTANWLSGTNSSVNTFFVPFKDRQIHKQLW